MNLRMTRCMATQMKKAEMSERICLYIRFLLPPDIAITVLGHMASRQTRSGAFCRRIYLHLSVTRGKYYNSKVFFLSGITRCDYNLAGENNARSWYAHSESSSLGANRRCKAFSRLAFLLSFSGGAPFPPFLNAVQFASILFTAPHVSSCFPSYSAPSSV